MQDNKIIQSYLNNFRRHLSSYLKPGIGLACKVIPVKAEGAILDFSLGPDVKNEDQYFSPEDTVVSIPGRTKGSAGYSKQMAFKRDVFGS